MKKRNAPRRLKRRGGLSYSSVSLIVIVVLALAAYERKPAAEAARTAPTAVQIVTEDEAVLVPVPVRPVARGERLQNVPFTMASWPRSRIDKGFVKNVALYRGSITATALPSEMPIPVAALSDSAMDSNAVVENIPQGMRAITVRVDEESAVEGWARSGSFVDVIVVRSDSSENGALQSKVIAENVRILSAGRSADPLTAGSSAPKAPRTVTLLVTQEDALRIKTGANIGRLTFSLRGAHDQLPTDILVVEQDQLINRKPAKSFAAYQGTAKGPDGKVYYLLDNARWVEQN